ncbi:DUF3644 domain-containing protein [Dietzia sp. SLG510A3-3B2-2]|nr:DUF3644 domain-containing protein [Dietzia sp. SLG510A3-40A3]MBB1010314.1 DUF3644 domain-containing protein [Dietzia sp. SLG510A3-3B2-2]
MAPRPKWWHILQASKNEAVLAIDLYNRSGKQRQLEAFIVHMSLAWLRLFQAKTLKDGGDLHTRDKKGHRIPVVDRSPGGRTDRDYVMKPLSALTAELLPENDPRRASLEFFTGLRNRIEHRYEKDISQLVAGKTQAHVINYEQTLVEWFDRSESVASELRFPIFASSITEDAVEAVKRVAATVPRSLQQWIYEFDSNLDESVSVSNGYDFRIFLIPQTGPKSQADAAVHFVNRNELSDDQSDIFEQVQVIVKNKNIHVSNLDKLLPQEVADRVQSKIGFRFSTNDHASAWRHYGVRPPGDLIKEDQTDQRYCVADRISKKYVYTNAWVNLLIKELSDPDRFKAICGKLPKPLSSDEGD